jgi:hypothetical protein
MLRSDDRLSFISCIVCVCETANVMIENWQSIQNMVAVYHQQSGEFEAWNMYLAFASLESIPVWEKYEIENNKFSVRKIVLDDLQQTSNLNQLIIELENQLLGADLTLETQKFQVKDNLLSLENYYRGAPLDSKSESREKRALMIDKLIESLNNNEN